MNKSITYLILLVFSVLAMFSCSESLQRDGNVELNNKVDTASYIIGLDYGISIKEEEIEVNEKAIYKGLLPTLLTFNV